MAEWTRYSIVDPENERNSMDDNMSRPKAKHVSLQPLIDNIAAESMADYTRRHSLARSKRSSTTYVANASRPRSMGHEAMPPAALKMDMAGFSNTEGFWDTQSLCSPVEDQPIIPPGQLPPMKVTAFHEALFIGVVIAAQFMALCGLGQGIPPMHIFAKALGAVGPGEEAWFTSAYALTSGTFILISGRIGDILGHKRMLVFGYFFLGVWSGFAGFSVYLGRQVFFDVCRAMQGIGTAILAPNALALLGRAYPPGIKKNLCFAAFGAMSPFGFVLGAIFSSVFSQYLWWPWTFWSYGLASWFLSVLALLVIPKALSYQAQFAGRHRKPGMDWSGSVTSVAGLVLVNVAWNNGPLYGWGVPYVYFILIIGVLVLGAFVWVELRAESPLLPVRVFNGTIGWAMLLVVIGWGSFGIWIWYSYRFLMDVRGLSPLTVSVEYIPAIICGLLAAGTTGGLITHTPVPFVMMLAMVAFCAGAAISAFQPVHQTYWAQMFVSIIIMPFGMDMSFPAATVIMSNQMPAEHQGLAASLVNALVNYSVSIFLGVAGTVEVQVNQRKSTPAADAWGVQCARYTGVALSVLGVVLGAIFFAKSLWKEGWKVMEH